MDVSTLHMDAPKMRLLTFFELYELFDSHGGVISFELQRAKRVAKEGVLVALKTAAEFATTTLRTEVSAICVYV